MAASSDRIASRAVSVAIAVFLALAPSALAAPPPGPFTPAALHAAYALPKTASSAQTVAVVVAYGDPTLGRDLSTFSRRFSLPACTAANGCLREVNQRGQAAPLPTPDPTGGKWTTEAALSTQTVHGICQNCRLLVVEADSEGKTDLAAAVDTAVALGAREVTTSYVFAEGALDAQLASHYDHPGVVITAASGDGGFAFGTNVPASYPGVVAVGGTNLRLGRAGRWAGESVWSNPDGASASGCSFFTAAPVWQAASARLTGCGAVRTVADVAAAAAPGAPLYSSTALTPTGERGWVEAGGTSLASPIVAAVFALAGGVGSGQSAAATLYAHLHSTPGAFHDVTSGANGSCSGQAICRARRGYDGPTGVGTPAGLAGFRAGGPAPASGSAPAVSVGDTAFVFPSHAAEIFLGCAARTACRGSLTLGQGNTLLAGRTAFTIAAQNGAIVHLRLGRVAARLLARVARHRLAVTLKILTRAGQRTTTPLILVGLERSTGGLAAVGGTAFVSPTGAAGVLVGCFFARTCKGTLALGAGGLIVSPPLEVTLAATDGRVVHLRLTAAGRRLFAHRHALSVLLSLQRAGARRSSTRLHLVDLR